MVSDTNTKLISDNQSDGTYISDYVTSDLYIFDEKVTVNAIVDGTAFVFGNNITISGEIGGDLFAFGVNVTVKDTAYIHGIAIVMIGFGIILLNLISRKNLEDTKTENKIEETNPI